MAGLPTITQMGAPNYGRLKGKEGIVFHTPENATPSIEDAIATAKWQAGSSNTSGGSYHGILGYDDDLGPMSDPKAWVLVKTVPFTDIAGSISTNRDPAIWQPGRFPWIKELLSPAAYADPNAYLHALCLGGRAAWWSRKFETEAGAKEVHGAVVAMAKWVRRLEGLFDYDAVLTLHRMWQTNRTDPDGLDFADRVLVEYERLRLQSGGTTGEPVEGPTKAELEAKVADLEAQVLTLTEDLGESRDRNARLIRRMGEKDKQFSNIITSANLGKEA